MTQQAARVARIGLSLAAIVAVLAVAGAPARAAGIEVIQSDHVNRFPASMAFTLQARGDAPIQSATLFYTASSGTSTTNRAVTEFQPSTQISTTATVETGNRHYLPPGTGINYWWEIADSAGTTLKTDPVSFSYDDQRFKWSSVDKEGVTVYWYSVGQQRGQQILDAALSAAQRLADEAGVKYDHPMKIWVYASKQDLDPALPQTSPSYQEQTVTLGVRLSADVMALLGNHPDVLATVAHETSHMVIHQAIDNPFGDLPAWLDEGLAMYAQGDLPPEHQRELQTAKNRDTLMSVRSLSSYVGDPSKVNLFYAQSDSFVDYLIKTSGRDKMNQLLQVYKRGTTNNAALQEVYGFNVDGLDQRWRAWLGAKPRPTVTSQQSTEPQAVPTIPLLTLPQSSQSGAATPAPSPANAAVRAATPAPASTIAVAATQTSGPPQLGLIVIGALVGVVVVLGAILLVVLRYRRAAT